TRDHVFVPTGTSDLLVAASAAVISSPKKMLDLGCGSGFVGLALAKLGRCTSPLYASDVSADAVALASENARGAGVSYIAKEGSMFSPWGTEKFDVIIDDVAGISDDIAALSSWYPSGVHCDAGRDGTKWICQILAQASGYLEDRGVLIFPVLSLSNEERILRAVAQSFSSYVVIGERDWFLPDAISEKTDLLTALLADGSIRCKQKFGKWLWSTRIYQATNGRLLS
ncbi:MAG: methyltransferase, partial [Acidobacteriota bacterium]